MWYKVKLFFKTLFGSKPAPTPSKPIEPVVTVPKPLGPIGSIEGQIGALVAEEIKNYPELIEHNTSVFFWQCVFKAMAYAESSFKPASRYVESGISTKDMVTGGANTSEGLFQLSYQDAKLHGAPFNWSVDKNKMPLDPTKTIFDLRNNTIAAMIILNKQLGKGLGLITKSKPYYWAVLDTSRPGHKVYLNKFNKLIESAVIAPSSPVTTSGIKNVAIIIGHGAGDSGATGQGTSEFVYNSKVAAIIEGSKDHGKNIKLFWRDSRGISGVNGDVKKYQDDLSIELHLNSYNGTAKGCEVLTLAGDTASIKIAQSFADSFCKEFDRVKRNIDGVKELASSDRGHYSLLAVNDPPPSILVEPFFIDNKDEWIAPDIYAAFIIKWLKGLV